MADRTRLLVAYLLRGRAQIAVDVLRQILRSSEIGRIAPHITLIPPVNVARARASDLGRALEAAVTKVAPVILALRGVETFQPHQRVLYLPVLGELAQLSELRARCQVGEFAVTDERNFVPHVTVRSHAGAELIASVPSLFGAFECPIILDRVTILERDATIAHGIWEIRDEFVLGSSRTSGRGGREVTCTTATHVGNDDKSFLIDNGVDPSHLLDHREPPEIGDVVVRARVEGVLVGLCALRVRDRGGEIGALVIDEEHRRQGIGRQILKYIEQNADELSIDSIAITVAEEPSGFFLQCGFEDVRVQSQGLATLRLSWRIARS